VTRKENVMRKVTAVLLSVGALLGWLGWREARTDAAAAGREDGEPHLKIEGTWVGTNSFGSVFTITFVPASPANNLVSFAADIVNFDSTLGGLFPQVSPEQNMAIRGDAVRTGPDTFDVHWITYLREEDRSIVYVDLNRSSVRFTAPDTYVETGTFSVYSAIDDPDFPLGPIHNQIGGDGLPMPGEVPVLCIPYESVVKRLVPSPPCEP
jgi:hypothetical protein